MTFTTGTSDDITDRVKKVIPRRWFSFIAPYRDAIIGGASDLGAWGYDLIQYAKAQTRLATSYGPFLDIYAYDFLRTTLTRSGLQDGIFRALIQATILKERVTRLGMVNALTTLTGAAPTIFEPWSTQDATCYSGKRSLGGPQYGSAAYGIGGGYGSMQLPAQVFVKVNQGPTLGVPGVAGYTNNIGGWGVGAIEYVGKTLAVLGITDTMIYTLIQATKPTGVTVWVAINPPVPQTRPQCIFNSKRNSQYIAAI